MQQESGRKWIFFGMRHWHIGCALETFSATHNAIFLTYLSNTLLLLGRFGFYAAKVNEKCGLLDRVWGFIDGTICQTCCPTYFQWNKVELHSFGTCTLFFVALIAMHTATELPLLCGSRCVHLEHWKSPLNCSWSNMPHFISYTLPNIFRAVLDSNASSILLHRYFCAKIFNHQLKNPN